MSLSPKLILMDSCNWRNILSMFFIEKFILTYVRSSRLGISFKFLSLFKKVWFHVHFRQGRLVYLYIIFFILRHFFKQTFQRSDLTFWPVWRVWPAVNNDVWYKFGVRSFGILCHVCEVCNILLTFQFDFFQ